MLPIKRKFTDQIWMYAPEDCYLYYFYSESPLRMIASTMYWVIVEELEKE